MDKEKNFDKTQCCCNNEEVADGRQDNENTKNDAECAAKEGCCKNQDCDCVNEEKDSGCKADLESELDQLKKQLEEKTKQCEEYFRQLQRAMAEFDNYKKRTAKEKEAIYTDAVSDVVTAFLPVIDSIGSAVAACSGEYDKDSVKEGIELIHKQVSDVMKKLEVEEIESVGGQFDPQFHNAVMHVEDESLEANVIVEEFQKGYKFKDKVIRYSMVKVAN